MRDALKFWCGAVLAAALLLPACYGADPVTVSPQTMRRIGSVDERFQSFNIEMVEVTGGRFWAPYKMTETGHPAGSPPAIPGLDPAAFRYRPPVDLANPKLRKLAAALGPAYVRVSGTWANSTYFQDSDQPALSAPPTGFGGVLTRQQWRGVIDFAKATDTRIVTSYAVSEGTRNASGAWTPVEAQKLIEFTKSAGGRLAAVEFFNEPSFASLGGLPKGYDAAAYGRDFKLFLPFARKNLPGTLILGPGSLGESKAIVTGIPILRSEDILKAAGPGLDVFSYHYYGGASKRCNGTQTAGMALLDEWLSGTERDEAFYAALRDRFEPGKPMWLTETGETGCGGNPWASTFIDSFRYLEQLGRLAKKGVQVVAHNTLAASDYGLLDEDTLEPRPDYWSALLWHKLMGRTVLDSGVPASSKMQVYAHCLSGHPGGVALLAANADRQASHDLEVPVASERYQLTAITLLNSNVDLNGVELRMGDQVPELKGRAEPAGVVRIPPGSITFLAIPAAGNRNCR
ncbi:MAG TPA: hypothetical protein VG456_19915 [Candidatus Sulfopaludibacter sp.]|jgi:hypothetical protein|nr:hypothetical protein [Candidatus Sulfopaludibacter sp.]